MKVIFTENLTGVALKGDVKNVKKGFFRNYLLPYKKAVLATDGLMGQWEERRKKMLIEKEHLKDRLEEMKRRLDKSSIKIEKKITKKGTLYGGIKASDVVKTIKDQFNIEVPETAVVMADHIKSVGTFNVTLKFGDGIETTLPLEIVEKKATAPAA